MTTLVEKAYQAMRRDIVCGALCAGQPLRMAQLSERYNMGSSPLREALTRLQSERLVMSVAMCGFSVAPLSTQEMWDAMNTRMYIETEALRLSMHYGDDTWEAEVVAAHHALMLQAERAAQFSGNEVEILEARHGAFHRALIAACNSEWLLDFSRKLYNETERYRYLMFTNRNADTARNIPDEHEQLMRAVLSRNFELACELLHSHLNHTAQFLDSFMGQQLSPEGPQQPRRELRGSSKAALHQHSRRRGGEPERGR